MNDQKQQLEPEIENLPRVPEELTTEEAEAAQGGFWILDPIPYRGDLYGERKGPGTTSNTSPET